jgi:hypothetical protein
MNSNGNGFLDVSQEGIVSSLLFASETYNFFLQ